MTLTCSHGGTAARRYTTCFAQCATSWPEMDQSGTLSHARLTSHHPSPSPPTAPHPHTAGTHHHSHHNRGGESKTGARTADGGVYKCTRLPPRGRTSASLIPAGGRRAARGRWGQGSSFGHQGGHNEADGRAPGAARARTSAAAGSTLLRKRYARAAPWLRCARTLLVDVRERAVGGRRWVSMRLAHLSGGLT